MATKTFRESMDLPLGRIDLFEHTQQDYTLHLTEPTHVTYAMFLKNAEIKLTVMAECEEVKGEIFAFIAGGTTTLQVDTKLQASHSSLNVHLIAIQREDAQVKMQGMIDIAPGIEKVSGHLLEEVLLLGNAKYTSLQPILNVASPDVQASHGAKVHKIPQEHLFYMQSRGLSEDLALKMIIKAYVEQILGHFDIYEEKKNQIYSFIK